MRRRLRPTRRALVPLLATIGCVDASEEGDETIAEGESTSEGESDTTTEGGQGGPCEALGTEIPGYPITPPGDDIPLPDCSEGWASDAPLREPDWVVTMGDTYHYGATIHALAEGRTVLVDSISLRWFDGAGSETSETLHGLDAFPPHAVHVRDADGHVFIAQPGMDDLEIHEFDESGSLGQVDIVTPGIYPRPLGLFPFADDWLIVGEEYDELESQQEAFFMQVDALGAELLRKARPLPVTGGYYYGYYAQPLRYAAFDGTNLLFGPSGTQWLVDAASGSVINQAVTVPGPEVIGLAGGGFATTGVQINTTMDGVLAKLGSSGFTQWTQVYDRASTSDQLLGVASLPDGSMVAVGLAGLWYPVGIQQQPLVIGVDPDGNAQWVGLLASIGVAIRVDVGPDGGIAVLGSVFDEQDPGVREAWIARW